MKTTTKSVIKLSELPIELQKDQTFVGHKIHTYAEFHIDDCEQDELTLWLLSKCPELKRKISFLIHIDIQQERSYSEKEALNLVAKYIEDNLDPHTHGTIENVKEWFEELKK